jgi:tyrosine-specific transport protein
LRSSRPNGLILTLLVLACVSSGSVAFQPTSSRTRTSAPSLNVYRHRHTRRWVSSVDDVTKSPESNAKMNVSSSATTSSTTTNTPLPNITPNALASSSDTSPVVVADTNTLWSQLNEKIGTIDESRITFAEYDNGDVPRMFSALQYNRNERDGQLRASHMAGSVGGAAALVAGTTIGAGVLAVPAATAAAGFLPSSAAMLVAWFYMTMSGLLIAELTLNRMGGTGRPGLGLLDLYNNSLGRTWGAVGSAAYMFLHYAVMVAYVAQGGANLAQVLPWDSVPDGVGPAAFVSVCAVALFNANRDVVEKVNNGLVVGVAATFLAIVAVGAQTADFGALVNISNQHPEHVVDCFPILFLSLVFQNVVPTVVDQLEGDRSKITKAIIAGTTAPLLLFLAWNAVVLGNVAGTGVDLSVVDPVALLQSGGGAGLLGPLVTGFSTLAVVTSLIGFTYGLRDGWADLLKLDTKSADFEAKSKLPLFALIFGPPLALACANPDIFYDALEYGGAFGVSTLFLILPPLMVWKERYGDDQTPLATKPMVPFGKLPLGSMWKAAGTLILEQGAEKLGVFAFLQEHVLSKFQS